MPLKAVRWFDGANEYEAELLKVLHDGDVLLRLGPNRYLVTRSQQLRYENPTTPSHDVCDLPIQARQQIR